MKTLSLAVLAMVLWTSAAPAQEAQEVDAQELERSPTDPAPENLFVRDPILPASIAVAGAGLTSTLAGAVVWGRSEPSVYCGALGCLTGPNNSAERGQGAALVGVGAGLAVAGAAGLAFSLAAPLEPGEERDAPGVATTGFVLTSMSLGALAGGFTFGGAGASKPDVGKAWPFFLASGVFGGVGVPLFIAGVSPQNEAERNEEARQRRLEREHQRAKGERRAQERRAIERGEIETELKSPALIGVGSFLMAAGVGGLVACSVAAANVRTGGFMDFSGLERIGFIAGGIASLGAGAGAGIPLVVIGSRRVPKSSEEPKPAPTTSSAVSAPHIAVGLGTVALEASLW
ncbi:MAG: hypothetical protein HOV80_32235 [Polyangiaceae bacterium]|nr:hypothetical protein [Polyangiaceae bacterium]